MGQTSGHYYLLEYVALLTITGTILLMTHHLGFIIIETPFV